MKYTTESFGTLPAGEEVYKICLENTNGMQVAVLNYGGIIQSIVVPDRSGRFADVVLGYDSLEEYISDDCYFGATVGRVANRIKGAAFELNGQHFSLTANEGHNMLHGGSGFHKRLWDYEIKDEALCLHYLSPDGEDGFPGNLDINLRITLSDDNALRLNYLATTDKDTLCSLTNHSYFNLAGVGTHTAAGSRLAAVSGHQLQLAAKEYTPAREALIPTGEILSVEGSAYDFLGARAIGAEPLDGNLVLSDAFKKWDARVYEPLSGRFLSIKTSLPGLQVYNGSFISLRKGKGGVLYGPQCGVALEPQYYPDAIHHENFPQPILRAGEEYRHFIAYRFGVV